MNLERNVVIDYKKMLLNLIDTIRHYPMSVVIDTITEIEKTLSVDEIDIQTLVSMDFDYSGDQLDSLGLWVKELSPHWEVVVNMERDSAESVSLTYKYDLGDDIYSAETNLKTGCKTVTELNRLCQSLMGD